MALVIRRTAINEENESNFASVEVNAPTTTLLLAKNGKQVEFDFTSEEWLAFIAGTFDVEDMLDQLGLSKLYEGFLRIGRVSYPEYRD